MSTINKKPFIKNLIGDLTLAEITTFGALIDGGGVQTPLLRTLNVQTSENRSHITVDDKGVHLCNLEIGFSLYQGYLVYSEHYCVLIVFTDAQVLSMFKITGLNFETVDEYLSVVELRSELNDAIPAEKIEAVDAVREALQDGDLKIEPGYVDSEGVNQGRVLVSDGEGGAAWGEGSTYKTFPTSWPTTGTTKAFCDAINADSNAVVGMAFLGSLSVTDGPFVGNGDTVVEIMPGPGGTGKAIHLVMTSGNVVPYHWEYTYWNNGSNLSGWISFGTEVVELSSSSGTLTDEQYKILSGDNGVIKAPSIISTGAFEFYHKDGVSSGDNGVLVYVSDILTTGASNSPEIKRGRFLIRNFTKTYQRYEDPVIYANPSETADFELTKLKVGGAVFSVGGFAGVVAPAYSSSSTYAEGDLVIYNNLLYECNTTISVAEAWNSAHWTQTTVAGAVLGALNTGV